MSFDHALYYPWIDIQNSEWLKTAILYWDNISTIVPEGMDVPYQTPETAMLRYENILRPYTVYSSSPSVERASETFSTFLDTEEASNILNSNILPSHQLNLDQNTSRLYIGKMTHDAKNKLLSFPRVRDCDYYLEMDNQTANYYMDLLAAEISQEQRWGLLTDSFEDEYLTNKVKRGESQYLYTTYNNNLRHAKLVEIVFRSIKIAPNTPLDDILLFRQTHIDELRSFRKVIVDYSNMMDPEIKNLHDLQNETERIYKAYIYPAISNLKKEMTNVNIGQQIGNLSAILFTTGDILLNPPEHLPFRIVKEGFEFISRNVGYHKSKLEKLNSNPWSYVLSLEQLE